MSNYEVATLLAPYAKYYVASEITEPNSGWNWGAMVSAMVDSGSR